MWRVHQLKNSAKSVSASRRTDIPALYGQWFLQRLEAGEAEYRTAFGKRRFRASLRPEDVTHLNFWSKWPRPFFPALERTLALDFPVLWNVTITGLGGSAVEPRVPNADRVVQATQELARMVPPTAIQWRYDPIFVSRRYPAAHHIAMFSRLAEQLADHVDRVAVSFPELYGRRVVPDLRRYEGEEDDARKTLSLDEQAELLAQLEAIAQEHGMAFTLCCQPQLTELLGCPTSGCNDWAWACRAWPILTMHRRLNKKPSRPGCDCSDEVDIGVYDTCTLWCRYSYGSCNMATADANRRSHDSAGACLLP